MAGEPWRAWVEDYLNFIGIFSETDDSVPIQQIEIGLQMGYDISSMYASDQTCLKILTFFYASFVLMRQKLINVTKTGITDWTLNQVTIRFDVNAVRTTADDFKKEWQELAKLCGLRNAGFDASFTFTNEGTGLFQRTQQAGPVYVRFGGGTGY